MKIEYLAGSQWPLPLVRLFDYREEEVHLLRRVCNDLADGRLQEFAVHDQSWVKPIAGCRFYWRAASKDTGVLLPKHEEPLVLDYLARRLARS